MKRCAIYTRKSTEEGLEQAFNSLDAQREACEAYIASQRHEGWKLIKTRFDDGGLSGGNLERPALQALLEEIDAGRIDIIVVYKVDRLTRSLADFAKLVERFDAKEVSFVSVTQAFNTSNSMGRLTLNVLLSFAQFEREVTAERIRDKIAASRKKGMWTGGLPPLGYDNVDKKLIINEAEAKTVRRLYDLYLATGCIRTIIDTATREGLTSKRRAYPRSGGNLTRGPVYFILSNPIYAGLVRAGKTLHEGEHEAIIDRKMWETVQAKRLAASQRAETKSARRNPLAGLLYADGARLTPTHGTKDGRRYRYYASRLLEKGPEASRLRWRVNAERIEAAIIEAIDDWLTSPAAASELLAEGASADDLICVRNEVEALKRDDASLGRHERLAAWAARVTRIDLDKDGITIALSPSTLIADSHDLPLREECIIHSAIKIGPRGQGLRMILGETETVGDADVKLVDLVRRAYDWRERWFSDREMSLKEISRSEGLALSDASARIRLAFLAPDIVRAIIAGTAPDELNAERLRRLDDLPASWAEQRSLLGFPQLS